MLNHLWLYKFRAYSPQAISTSGCYKLQYSPHNLYLYTPKLCMLIIIINMKTNIIIMYLCALSIENKFFRIGIIIFEHDISIRS